jgi:hypothetical protein
MKPKVEIKSEDLPKEAKPNYKYFCEGCTNANFLHLEGKEMPKGLICMQCGHALGSNKENLVKL